MNESMISIYILVSILVMLILGLAVVWFLNRAQFKITNEKLKTQEKEIEFKTELLVNTVRTQEKERIRISTELHDDVTSQLSIIHLNLHLLKKRINSEDESIVTIVDHIESSLKSSTDRTRTISHELMPSIFKKFGIQHALNELANGINIADAVSINIQREDLIKISDFDKQLHIYRIVQELVNNSLKYSEAKSLILKFEEIDGKKLLISYEDDGKGFDMNTVKEGLGTSNIKTRVQLLKGEMTLNSSPGNGMNALIKIPNYD